VLVQPRYGREAALVMFEPRVALALIEFQHPREGMKIIASLLIHEMQSKRPVPRGTHA
jgi:phage baseplate assembly protein W